MEAQGAPRIGKAIKRAREKKRWSQKEAADMLGVSRSALNAWENDRAYPRSSIGALEALYGIVIDDEPGPEPEPEPEPAIPRGIYDEIMGTDGLDDERKRAVVEAVERTLRGRGEGDASARGAREPPERRRPAS